MQKIPVVVVNHSQSDLNTFRYHAGQFALTLNEVSFSGDDVRTFLHTQSTFDIELMSDNSFHLTSFLDPQGRVECYGWLVQSEKKFSYLVPESITERAIARLNKFLISEDVYLSDAVKKTFFVQIGPEAIGKISGTFFDEKAFLESSQSKLPLISPADLELWRGLTGWPSFDGSDFSHEILNNLRLFDLSLIQNKGCYPGQETVSKIATRRGAAYSPVLVEMNELASTGEITSFDKKIGTAIGSYTWNEKFYLSASLLRDFRVEKMKIHFTLNGKDYDGLVRYFPLISGDVKEKAKELFYEGSDAFRVDDLKLAEEKFRLSVKLDPGFGDAYESLGVMLGRLDRYPEAIELMKQLSSVEPKSVLAHTNMSLFLMKMGRIEEAEEQKSLATVKSFQTFGDEFKTKEAETALKKKQQDEWAQRESMFRQVLEIDPEDTLANYGLGSIAVEKSDWGIARDHLEKVLKADPKYSVAYLALGKALKGLGLFDEAKNIWREGIKVSAAKGDLMPANQMQQELNF
jgi:folate-binding Fe-S cluster repair protein YgfZ/Tfp pilus assembly protein PilF